MANYIGNIPSQGEFKKLDSIASSFDGSTTQFNLNYSSVSQSVGGAEQLIVSLNGVIQEPLTSYTLGIGGSSIVFASAPQSGDTCHIVLFGGIGGTLTPSDQSVTPEKLSAELKDYYEDEFTANGSTTDFTLSREATGVNQLMVSIDGILQPTSAYTVSGTTFTVSPALPNGTNIRVVHMGVKAGVFVPQQNSVGLDEIITSELDSRYYTETEVDNALALKADQTDVDLKAPIANPSFTGNVGIGASSPVRELQVGDNTGANEVISIQSSSSGKGSIMFGDNTTTSAEYAGMLRYDHANNSMQFWGASTERARIDSSGNLLVGTDSSSSSTAGIKLTSAGTASFVRSGVQPIYANRLTSDGDIMIFAKDSSTVGTIGTPGQKFSVVANTDYMTVGTQNIGLRFANAYNTIHGYDPAIIDNKSNIDLGYPGIPFGDLYLSGGIQFDSRSNKLDDYEEGSVANPINVGGTDITSYTGGYNYANYVKVGRHVIFHVASSTTQSGPTGNVAINLPFMPAAQFTQEINYYDDGYYKRTGWATGGTGLVEVTDININNRISRASSTSNIIIRCTFSYYTNS